MSEKRPVIIIDGKWRPYWRAVLGHKAGTAHVGHMMLFRYPQEDRYEVELLHADGRKERFARQSLTIELRHTDRRPDETNRWFCFFTGERKDCPDLVAYDGRFSSVSWHAKDGAPLCVPPTNHIQEARL